jgi:hypothetical protein
LEGCTLQLWWSSTAESSERSLSIGLLLLLLLWLLNWLKAKLDGRRGGCRLL